MTDKYKSRQERFLRLVNQFAGLPPVFKFDGAFQKIILVEAPPLFIEALVKDGASLSLSRDGISVHWY